jgi:lysophospholipase L1-like esterase
MSKRMLLLPVAASFLLLFGGGSAFATSPLGASGGPSYGGTVPSAAFDGNHSTYWQGAYNAENTNATSPFDVTSWRLTYGYSQPMVVSGVTVAYATDSRFIARNAHVDCSTDGDTWTQLAAVPGGQQTATATFAGTSCQWVSLYMEAPGTGYTPAVAEMTITAAPTLATATSLVAVGDSITAGSYAPNSYVADLPIWREITYYNQGVSGNTTGQMLARFSTVLGTGGQVVVIMGGTNDCQFGTATSTTVANIDAMVSQAINAGRLPVIVGPIPRNGLTDAGVSFAPCLTALRSALQVEAVQRGVVFADPWPAFENPVGSGHLDDALTEDGIHPNARGAFELARVVAHAAGWGFSGD